MPYASIPFGCGRVLVRGLLFITGDQWECSFDFVAGGGVPPGSEQSYADDLAIQFDALWNGLLIDALNDNATIESYQAVVQSDTGGAAETVLVHQTIGGLDSTGDDIPQPICAVVARHASPLGRKFQGRFFWPVGNSKSIDAVQYNRLSGTAHTAIEGGPMQVLLNPTDGGLTSWVPALFNTATPFHWGIHAAAVRYDLSWRRSRKVKVGT